MKDRDRLALDFKYFRGIKCKEEGRKTPTHSYYWVHRLDYATSGVLCVGKTVFLNY